MLAARSVSAERSQRGCILAAAIAGQRAKRGARRALSEVVARLRVHAQRAVLSFLNRLTDQAQVFPRTLRRHAGSAARRTGVADPHSEHADRRGLHDAVRAVEALAAVRHDAAPHRPGAQCDRDRLDRGQQRVDRCGGPYPLGRSGTRGTRAGRLVPGVEQPPELGRHPGAAEDLQPPDSAAEVLPEARTDLGAGYRARVVGAGFPVHATARRPGWRRRPRACASGLQEVQRRADLGDQLSRRHALHARQARCAGLAVSPPAEAEGRRHRHRAKHPRQPVPPAARCDDRLPRWRPRVLDAAVRPAAAGGRARRAARDPAGTALPATTPAIRPSARACRNGSTRCGCRRTR